MSSRQNFGDFAEKTHETARNSVNGLSVGKIGGFARRRIARESTRNLMEVKKQLSAIEKQSEIGNDFISNV